MVNSMKFNIGTTSMDQHLSDMQDIFDKLEHIGPPVSNDGFAV